MAEDGEVACKLLDERDYALILSDARKPFAASQLDAPLGRVEFAT